MYKLIIFDLDDTLYYERDYVFEGFKNVALYLEKKYSLKFEEIYEKIKNIFYEEGRGQIFNLLCENLEINENIDRLVEVYRSTEPREIKLYDDAIYFINYLKEKDYKLGIITDGLASVQRKKLKSLGLYKLIDKIIVTDELGREFWKPSTKSYKDILEEFNIAGDEAIYIGDNPSKDFIGARKLGIRTIRIIREQGDHIKLVCTSEFEADYNIRLLTECIGREV